MGHTLLICKMPYLSLSLTHCCHQMPFVLVTLVGPSWRLRGTGALRRGRGRGRGPQGGLRRGLGLGASAAPAPRSARGSGGQPYRSSPFSSPQSRSSVMTRPVRLLLPAAGGSGALPLATQEMGPAQAEQRLQGVPRLPCLLLSRLPGPAHSPQEVTRRGWFQALMKAAETRTSHT